MFKPGDRVRQINKDYGTSKIGWEGIIERIVSNDSVYIRFNHNNYENYLHVLSKDLELVEPKVNIKKIDKVDNGWGF